MLPGCQPKCFLTSKGIHIAAFLQPHTLVDHHHEKVSNINANIKKPTEGPCNAAIYYLKTVALKIDIFSH